MNKTTKTIVGTFIISTALLAIYISPKLPKSDKLSDNQKSVNSTNRDQTNAEVSVEKLSIINTRCRGCGKCFQIDPIHFQMNSTTRKAEVISQQNLDTVSLIQAINNCRDNAIVLS